MTSRRPASEGVLQNDALALEWFRKAAEQGDAFSQSHLGIKYASGEGVLKNEKEAVSWMRKAE